MIRKIMLCDIPKIIEIENCCFSQIWSQKNIEDALNNERNIMLCDISEKGELLGYLFADFILDEVNLNRIAVNSSFRKKGIATGLLNELEGMISDFGSKIMLEVRESNFGARSFYEKYGFENDGIRKNFYTHPLENAILMTKTLRNE